MKLYLTGESLPITSMLLAILLIRFSVSESLVGQPSRLHYCSGGCAMIIPGTTYLVIFQGNAPHHGPLPVPPWLQSLPPASPPHLLPSAYVST